MYFVCCLCEACEFWDGFHGQLDNRLSGTDHGEKPTSILFTLGGEWIHGQLNSGGSTSGLTRKESPSACVLFVAYVKGPSLGRDFLVSSMIVDAGLAMERIHQHVFWSFTLGGEWIHGQLSSGGCTSGLTRKESPSACVLFVACVKGPSFGRDFMANSTMVGLGLTMEGIHQNEVIYEFMMENAYRPKPTDVSAWYEALVCCSFHTVPCSTAPVRLCPRSCKTYLSYLLCFFLSVNIIYERKT